MSWRSSPSARARFSSAVRIRYWTVFLCGPQRPERTGVLFPRQPFPGSSAGGAGKPPLRRRLRRGRPRTRPRRLGGRPAARAGGQLGREIAAYQARGDLVPDQIVLDVLTPAVVEAAARGGYILDGFPRTLPPAIAAAELAGRLGVTLEAAVYLYAPEAVLTRRLLDRARQGGRADDTADVIRHRLQVFAETTGPLVPYYTERGILIAVDADQPPETVTADIQARLAGLTRVAGR
jgi:adenylate kinase